MEKKKTVDIENKTILVTGAVGFIGYNLLLRLLRDYDGITLVGVDNYSDYYEVSLKEYRASRVNEAARDSDCKLHLIRCDIADRKAIEEVFVTYKPSIVINLAAQAGVRYSIENPDSYIKANINGFYNILELCRSLQEEGKFEHLVFASSSSVYGGNEKVPFCVDDNVDHPVSLYAATKKCDELLAYSYAKLYNIPSTGLRFFTVYGPAGRPDMAYFSFTEKLRAGEKINIFNYGKCQRDFTYIDDIIEGVVRVIKGAPVKGTGDDGLPIAPNSIYNIGGGRPENLMDFVHILAEELIRAGVLEESFCVDDHISFLPMQPGDVPLTYADASPLERDYGFRPKIDLRTGLRYFAQWYRDYYC